MSVNDAFKAFQGVVNADIDQVRLAGTQQPLQGSVNSEPDVDEVVASGSLARGTHKDPIHDVDVVVVFDGDQHPDWGQPGTSAEDALDYTRGRVNALLGATNGTYEKAVRLAQWRNHAVKASWTILTTRTPSPSTPCLRCAETACSSSPKQFETWVCYRPRVPD